MADRSGVVRCEVTLGVRVPDVVLDSLRERFDDVSTTVDGTGLVVMGLDQAAVRALVTHLWDVGLAIHAMTWSPLA
jgi:hypothetical protein